MSETVVLSLVVALVFIVVLLVAVILYLFSQLLKERSVSSHRPEHATEPSREGVPRKVPEPVEIAYCTNHPQDHAQGVCAICQEPFCDSCVKEHDGLTFCSPHFRLYVSHDWVELESIKTSPQTPESAFPIYDFKQSLWRDEGLPAIISTHYKINIEGDTIESYVKLLVRSDEEEELKRMYQSFVN